MPEEDFREKVAKSPVRRTKGRGLLRNVAAALSGADGPSVKTVLVDAQEHPEGSVRQQAGLSLSTIKNNWSETERPAR
jgi:epoxyqueuosine reductase